MLSRQYVKSLQDRVTRNPKLKSNLLKKAVNSYFKGDYETGKGTLRQLIHVTIGFERLSKETKTPSKSLHRMLGPKGNPNTGNFFAILFVLQKRIDANLTAKVTRHSKSSRTVN